MSRHNKGQSSHPAEKMSVPGSQECKKRKDAIQDEGKSKAHKTETTEATALITVPVTPRLAKSKARTSTEVTPRFAKIKARTSTEVTPRIAKSKIVTFGKKSPTGIHGEGGILVNKPSTSSSELLTSNKNNQTKSTVTSIIKPVHSCDHAVTADISSGKNLEVCNEKPQDGDKEEKRISGTSLDTRSSPADDRTQQSKRDVQYEQTVHTGLSGKEKTQSTLQASKLPLKICGEKRLLFNGPLDEQTFSERSGKKIKSDCNSVQNSVQTEAEIKKKKKSYSEVKTLISFKQESMNGFWKDTPVTVDLQEYRNYTPMVDQPLHVDTSWGGGAAQNVEIIARKSKQEVNFDVNTPSSSIEPADFFHYAKIVKHLLVWHEMPDRKDIFFKIGKFTLKLQSSNLYCCPFNQVEKERKFPDRQLSYATLTTSENLRKKYSQTAWNYVVGNHGKVYSHIETPQDAVALCAILFSEVIRYPNMFFHNILMMLHFKTWDDFCNYHPMVKGGTWKYQGRSSHISQENLQRGIKIPEKVKNREHENHLLCVKEMIKDKESICTPFQLRNI